MEFFEKYAFMDKPKKKVRKDSSSVILDSINDQRRILKGELVKRNGKTVSTWERDGLVTPRVSGLNLFDNGNGGGNTTSVSNYENFLDDLESAVKAGQLASAVASFDKRRNERDAKLNRQSGGK